jgi:hypothetical protein
MPEFAATIPSSPLTTVAVAMCCFLLRPEM